LVKPASGPCMSSHVLAERAPVAGRGHVPAGSYFESDSVQARACSCALRAGKLVRLLHWAHRAGTPLFVADSQSCPRDSGGGALGSALPVATSRPLRRGSFTGEVFG
jgi:hypothetical protein